MPAQSENAATVSLDEAPVFGSFVSSVALTFSTRLMAVFAVFATGVIIARRLGADGFGIYAVLNVTVALAVHIGSAGLQSANTFFLARDRKTLGPIFANTIITALLIGGILAIVVLGINWLRPSSVGQVSLQLLAVALTAIPFQLLFVLGLNILLAIDRIRQLNLLDAMFPVWVLVNAIIVLVVWREGLFALVSLNTLAITILSLLVCLAIFRELSKRQPASKPVPDLQLLKGMFSYGVKFYVSIVAGAIIMRADLLFVDRFYGEAAAGVYAIAAQASFLLLMLPAVIATLLFPRVASSQDRTGEFASRVTRHTTLVMLLMCLASIPLAFLLPLVYGPQFKDATFQLLMLLPGVFFLSLESVQVQHFTGTGLPAIIPVFWIITLVFNLAANLLLVPAIGARGAALSSSLSYALIFVLVAVYFAMKTGRGPAETFILRGHELRNLLSPRRLISSLKAAQ
jgi:O-antigen/teichoic acid export membrane protein